MHAAAYAFVCTAIADLQPRAVLEIGSLDVNSTAQRMNVRTLVGDAAYTGIDTHPGLGVDIVASAADYDGDGAFDLVLSTEAMEHTPHPRDIVDCAWRALRPGGTFVLTAAGPERAPHGCDGGALPLHEHYANIEPAQLRALLADWRDVRVARNPSAGDVYAVAIRPEA